jgi:NAD(P)-dependent dehydrogenase (short-subunit alcohol dehydrogenase family)
MNKVALVTGSTSNIGKAVAERFARDGFDVVVTSRHAEEARTAAAALPKPGRAFALDFADPVQIDALFAFVKKECGRIDVLVNNVAMTKNESIFDCDLDTWNRTIDVNLRSYYLCMRHAAVMMRDAKVEGSIVNITVGVTRGVPNKFSYITSKGGVNFMTMSAALDLAPYGIRVNAIGSGPVGTAVGYRTMEGRAHENLGIPLGRIGEPEDIANAAAFLSSDAAKYITAALLPVDGGGIVGSMGGGHQLARNEKR